MKASAYNTSWGITAEAHLAHTHDTIFDYTMIRVFSLAPKRRLEAQYGRHLAGNLKNHGIEILSIPRKLDSRRTSRCGWQSQPRAATRCLSTRYFSLACPRRRAHALVVTRSQSHSAAKRASYFAPIAPDTSERQIQSYLRPSFRRGPRRLCSRTWTRRRYLANQRYDCRLHHPAPTRTRS